MNSGKYVFSQLLEFVDKYEFEKCVERYKDDYRVRELNCRNQFIQLFFGQLTSLNSLRDICLCLKAHKRKLYHLGIKQNVSQSALSRANEKRDWRIFADFGEYLIQFVRPLYSDNSVPNVDIDNEILALDSTTVSLSIKLFSWAQGKYSCGTVKVHTLLDLRGSIPSFIPITDEKYHDGNTLDISDAIYLMDKAYVDFTTLYHMRQAGAFFVIRAKSPLQFSVIEQNFNIDESTGLRTGKTVILTGCKSKKLYLEMLRLVEFYNSEKDVLLVFLTNNFEVTTLEVTYLYKNRWQIYHQKTLRVLGKCSENPYLGSHLYLSGLNTHLKVTYTR